MKINDFTSHYGYLSPRKLISLGDTNSRWDNPSQLPQYGLCKKNHKETKNLISVVSPSTRGNLWCMPSLKWFRAVSRNNYWEVLWNVRQDGKWLQTVVWLTVGLISSEYANQEWRQLFSRPQTIATHHCWIKRITSVTF